MIAQGERTARVQGVAEDGAGPHADDHATGQADPRLDQACGDARDARYRQPERAQERCIDVELAFRSGFDNVHSIASESSLLNHLAVDPAVHRAVVYVVAIILARSDRGI